MTRSSVSSSASGPPRSSSARLLPKWVVLEGGGERGRRGREPRGVEKVRERACVCEVRRARERERSRLFQLLLLSLFSSPYCTSSAFFSHMQCCCAQTLKEHGDSLFVRDRKKLMTVDASLPRLNALRSINPKLYREFHHGCVCVCVCMTGVTIRAIATNKQTNNKQTNKPKRNSPRAHAHAHTHTHTHTRAHVFLNELCWLQQRRTGTALRHFLPRQRVPLPRQTTSQQ